MNIVLLPYRKLKGMKRPEKSLTPVGLAVAAKAASRPADEGAAANCPTLSASKGADTPSWAAGRFDCYFSRTLKAARGLLDDPNIRVVAFDIFDTLLSRPLLDPETTKEIVAQRAGEPAGELYHRYRIKAEAAARQRAGRERRARSNLRGVRRAKRVVAGGSNRPAASRRTGGMAFGRPSSRRRVAVAIGACDGQAGDFDQQHVFAQGFS